MGLLAQLGFVAEPPNALQVAAQKLGSSRQWAWVFSKTLYPMDRVMFRLSGGRLTLPSLLAGVPVILLTTTGARTGQPRTMPLLGIPFGDDLAIIGSNYGQEATPGWVYNLEADPNATVEYRGKNVPVVARLADDDETARAFEAADDVYLGYAKYRSRADHRRLRVFVLESLTAA